MAIYVKDVIRNIRESSGDDKTFAIQYRKRDGSFGEKNICRNRSGSYVKSSKKSDLTSVKTESKRAGKAYLEFKTSTGKWQPFEIFWCLMTRFNGKIIDHRF